MKPVLIVFLRKPELGKAKTRLAATIGDEKALAVYSSLLTHTLECTQPLDVIKQAWSVGNGSVTELVGPFGFSVHEQLGDDLGQRMEHAFASGFGDGHGPVLIIGTDCPGMSSRLIKSALDALRTYDAVLGPARDGGYYLLGLNAPLNDVFRKKAWSTDAVAKDTLRDLERDHRSVCMLPELIDVDTEQDLIDSGWN